MFADSGASLPPGIRTAPPSTVAAAIVRAIERNRAEVDVAPLAMRAGAPPGGRGAGPRRVGEQALRRRRLARAVERARQAGELGLKRSRRCSGRAPPDDVRPRPALAARYPWSRCRRVRASAASMPSPAQLGRRVRRAARPALAAPRCAADELVEARELLAYWERRARRLPRWALMRRREARAMAPRVARAASATPSRSATATACWVRRRSYAVERRMPTTVAHRGRQAVRLAALHRPHRRRSRSCSSSPPRWRSWPRPCSALL